MKYEAFADYANSLPKSAAKVNLAVRPSDIYEQAGLQVAHRIDPNSHSAQQRVRNSLHEVYRGFAVESWGIADQITDPEYQEYVKDTKDWLELDLYFEVCSDGRVSPQSVISAGVGDVRKVPRGLSRTRESTKQSGVYVLQDHLFAAKVNSDIQLRQLKGEIAPEPILVRGPHIDSFNPSNGCGAAKNDFAASGLLPDLAMLQDGGVTKFYADLGKGIAAFDQDVERAGGKGRTIEFAHDAYSDSLLFGLHTAVRDFDPNKTFRENITAFVEKKKVLSTEQLTEEFGDLIKQVATENNLADSLDFENPRLIAKNMMTIGKVARLMVENHSGLIEDKIPESVKKEQSEKSMKALMYIIFRNTAYRALGNIQNGAHSLQLHNEALVSSGPVSAIYNRRRIPLTYKSGEGPFDQADLATTVGFYNLFGEIQRHNGVDLSRFGRIVEVNGAVDISISDDPVLLLRLLNDAASLTRRNVAQLVERIKPAVLDGQALVVGCLRDRNTRRPLGIV